MKKSLKRLFVMVMAFAICVFGTSFAYAEDVTAGPEPENGEGTFVTSVSVVVLDESNGNSDAGIMPYSYDTVLSAASTDFSWDGTASCSIGRSFSNCGIKAGISSNSSVGTVVCSVKFPDGSMHGLGTLPSSGGMTSILTCGTLAPGTYTFYFDSSVSAKLTGVGYIVQN